MFTILQAHVKTVNNRFMMEPQKTVSAAAMEAEWLEIQAAQQNPAQFRPLYERYYESIFRFVFRRTADDDLAADICSQVFLKAMQRLSTYQFRGVPFSAWLFRIASNEVAQHFRNVPNQRTVSVDDASLGEIAEEMELDDDTGIQIQEMMVAMQELRAEEVTMIELRFFEQRPFKEIAERLNVSQSAIEKRIIPLYKRFNVKSLPHLISFAYDNNILP